MTAVTPLKLANVPAGIVSYKINNVVGSSSTYTYDVASLIKAAPADLWLSGDLAVQVREDGAISRFFAHQDSTGSRAEVGDERYACGVRCHPLQGQQLVR